jgi:hypothetical protein
MATNIGSASMPTLDTSELPRFVAADPHGPVVVLNLLRFAPGGADKYMQYIERFSSSGINERYDVRIIYGGTGTWSPSSVTPADSTSST